jgi:hypothetical protein
MWPVASIVYLPAVRGVTQAVSRGVNRPAGRRGGGVELAARDRSASPRAARAIPLPDESIPHKWPSRTRASRVAVPAGSPTGDVRSRTATNESRFRGR